MHINKGSKSKKIVLALVLLLLVAGAVFAYMQLSTKNDSDTVDTINTEKPTNEQIKAGNDTKTDTIESDNSKNPETPTTPTSKMPTLTITAANQNGATVQIRTLIDSVISSGTCTLVMTQGESSITRTVNVQALSSSSTCMGFDIPTSDLAQNGEWTIAITLQTTAGSTQATKNITIN